MVAQRLPIIRRKAKAKRLLHGGRHATVGEITARPRTPRRLELRLEEARRHLHDVIERGAPQLALFICSCRLRQRNARLLGEPLHRFREGEPFLLDEEGEDVTRLSATETIVAPLAVIGMEGGCLLVMKGAAGPEISARRNRLAPIPLHAQPDHGRHAQPRSDLVEKCWWILHSDKGSLSWDSTRGPPPPRSLMPVFPAIHSLEQKVNIHQPFVMGRVLTLSPLANAKHSQ